MRNLELLAASQIDTASRPEAVMGTNIFGFPTSNMIYLRKHMSLLISNVIEIGIVMYLKFPNCAGSGSGVVMKQTFWNPHSHIVNLNKFESQLACYRNMECGKENLPMQRKNRKVLGIASQET